MQVKITKLDVEMEVKNKGFEIDVRSADGTERKGDLVVTKSGLTWCKGKTRPENGKKISWKKFIAYMEALD